MKLKYAMRQNWCDYTWIPVNCYARNIRERFYSYPFSKITYHYNPINIKKPAVFFVGSMSDIEYWDKNFTKLVIDQCENNKRHTFMFLSKNPASYSGFNWPENTMQGVTMTCSQSPHDQAGIVRIISENTRPFISIEPLMGTLFQNDFSKIEKIIVGAMTGLKAKDPIPSWIDSIKNNAPKELLFWKENIRTLV